MALYYPNKETHTYEEIRAVVYAKLLELQPNAGGNFYGFKTGLAQRLRNDQSFVHGLRSANEPELSEHDGNVFLEIFWGLFREGIITLGADEIHPDFPQFRVTAFGRKILVQQDPYFFTDVSDYERLLKKEVPGVNRVTMVYVKEAVQTYKTGTELASSVMIGVASEHTLDLLVEIVEANPKWQLKFANAINERKMLRRLNSFVAGLNGHARSTLPAEIKEDLDTQFSAIASIIRTFRNDSGHPSGKIIDRYQAYVNLQLFIPYCRKLYQLMDFFKLP